MIEMKASDIKKMMDKTIYVQGYKLFFVLYIFMNVHNYIWVRAVDVEDMVVEVLYHSK